ncbi:MAG: Cthe_2314 family HEPN domain-containing protein [bacterium]
MTFYDKQYYFITSFFLQTLYNYWDKVGDLISKFFEINLPEHQIYFYTVLQYFPENEKDEYYRWFEDFLNARYKELNNERISVVHYQGIESKIHQIYMEGNRDESKMNELQNWKVSLLDVFLIDFQDTIKGFEMALKLIESKK